MLRDNNRPQESYCVLSRALELNMNIGVKTELKQLDKVLKAQRDAEKIVTPRQGGTEKAICFLSSTAHLF